MLNVLILMGFVCFNAVMAAIDLSSGDQIMLALRTARERKVYAKNFQAMAHQATEANDGAREELNNSLVLSFNEMKEKLTPSKLVILHTIETRKSAVIAMEHYTKALSQINDFIGLLEKRFNKLVLEDFE